jgi:hypothetical protein
MYAHRRSTVAHLPLGGEVSVTGGDAEEEGIVLGEGLRGGDGDVGLGGGVHLGEDLLRERLGDLVEVDAAAGGLDALFDALSDCREREYIRRGDVKQGEGCARLKTCPHVE